MGRRSALLYDTETALRLVDGDLRGLGVECGAPLAEPTGLALLPIILERANAEVQAVLAGLRDGRAALEAVTVERLQHTNSKLREVTSATEVAATDILDALDRAQGLVDDLEAADRADNKPRAQDARDRLRGELFGMMGALQFQDITTQQLAHAASVLSDVEGRLRQIAALLDPAVAVRSAGAAGPDPRTFDPHATTRDADRRQAAADEIFCAPR